MKIKYAGSAKESIVDGPGIRYTLFVQGCPHHCVGCHNPQTHDFNGGEYADTDDFLKEVLNNPLLDGVTLSGGEPFCQAVPLADFAKKVRESKLNVIIYTGFTFEYLMENANSENGYLDLIKCADYIVDGKFEIDKKDYLLKFKGSSNQRVIDVKKSLELNETIVTEF